MSEVSEAEIKSMTKEQNYIRGYRDGKSDLFNNIRAEIKSRLWGVKITLEVLVENDPLRPKIEGAKDTLEECLEIIDKAESEDKRCI